MSDDFPDHSIANSEGAIKGLLRSMQVKFGGMEANMFAKMANSPTALKAYIGLSLVFETSSLSPAEQQLVLLTVSRRNECSYCIPLHTTNGFIKGLHPDIMEAVRQDKEITQDVKLEALHQFTKTVMETRGQPPKEEVQAFLKAGYSKEQMLDVVAGIALNTLSNFSNHIMGTQLDEVFEMNSWEKEEQSIPCLLDPPIK